MANPKIFSAISTNSGVTLNFSALGVCPFHERAADQAVLDGTWHTPPYNQAAGPYNYSDMTGFNNRIVNRTGQPLKGYWIAMHDSGLEHQLWNQVSWTAALTNGCSVEVFVRAADERADLGRATFVQATNGVFFPPIRGQYLEVRVALVRDDLCIGVKL